MSRHQTQAEQDRVAELHRQARQDYKDGQEAREGLDRAEQQRREIWGQP